MDPFPELDILRFYRDEVKHEFNLLAMRSNILVTCQSFLVLPYAILSTAPNVRAVLVLHYLVAVLGIFVVLILLGPLNAAHRTINKWLLKQRALFKGSEALFDYALDRDMIRDVDTRIEKDRDHVRSLAFSRYGPWAFILFWCGAIIWSTVRTLLGF